MKKYLKMKFVFVNHGLILFELLAISVNATWSCDVKEDIDSIFTLNEMTKRYGVI